MGMPTEVTMLIRYSCKDMGLKCAFIANAETLEEVTRMALEHVREIHANDFNSINSPTEISSMERALSLATREFSGK